MRSGSRADPGGRSLCRRVALRRRARGSAEAAAATASGEEDRATAAARTTARRERMTGEARARARLEIAHCEAVLAKAGLGVLVETLRDATDIRTWEHYPAGDVFDPQSGAQWFYHCHGADPAAADPTAPAGEHGHFHCFVRPNGAGGPIHHLAAIGVDAHGRILRLFTVNQWVAGDDWLDAEETIALLPRFDVEMPRPSYLVNRWLTAVLRAHEDEIAGLIRARDRAIAAHQPPPGVAPREDRALEVTSELLLDAGTA